MPENPWSAPSGAVSLAQRVPWWLAVLLGSAVVLVGSLLAVRPFASLGALVVLISIGLLVTGIAELGTWTLGDGSRLQLLTGLLWITGGVVLLVVPALTIAALVLVVGLQSIISGLVRIRSAIRGQSHGVGTANAAMLGVSGVIIGILALTWPDVTVYVIAVVFGVRMLLVGAAQVIAALRQRRRATGERDEPVLPRHRSPVVGVLVLLTTLALVVMSAKLSATAQPDDFYIAPATVPSAPGALLRQEPFTADIPSGAQGWRILYTTTRDEGLPAVASAIVIVPEGGAVHPVIAWAHGTTGFLEGCAPSLLDHPFIAGAMPNLNQALAAGWAIVATDYVGLGTEGPHPYLIGQGEGRSVLDAVRAAHQMERARLGTQTVIWGHSQGGHAALWAGGLAQDYAPELDIVGVAAMAPAANLPGLLASIADSRIGALFGAYVIASYSAHFGDVRVGDYVRPGGRIIIEEMSRRCLVDPAMAVSLVSALASDQPLWVGNPNRGALAVRAEQNVPRLPIEAPLLLAQGEADTLVLPSAQQVYVHDLCRAGQAVDHRNYPGKDHMGLVTGDSALLPELITWTADRFAGRPGANSCPD